jgi:hypothetical protein
MEGASRRERAERCGPARSAAGGTADRRRGTLFVLEDDPDDPPSTRPRWFCHWDGAPAPGFENLEDAVSWGLERARTVIVRTLGTVFYWAGDRPSDWGDYDLEGGLRAWPPSAAERRAIDAAYAAAVAAERAESLARDAYEYARLGWLLEHAPGLAESEPAHECAIQLPGDDRQIEFEEFDPGAFVCGARCQGTGTYGFGSVDQALAAASGLAEDHRWVAAVCAALARERTWTRAGRRSVLLVEEASGEMFHATAAENRQSILRHGLDWRQMGAAPGIAGSREPELAAVFLCESREEVGFFTRMSRLPADVWAVRVDGLWVESGPDGWIILPEPVPPERLRLVEGPAIAS